MEYTKLGRTGLDVSRICLGCMSYGGGNRGNHAWSLRVEENIPFIKKACTRPPPAHRFWQPPYFRSVSVKNGVRRASHLRPEQATSSADRPRASCSSSS